MSFKMRVSTNYNGKFFGKGSEHPDNSVPLNIFERWTQRGLALFTKDGSKEETAHPDITSHDYKDPEADKEILNQLAASEKDESQSGESSSDLSGENIKPEKPKRIRKSGSKKKVTNKKKKK